MRQLVALLQARGFEVWIVSASPEVLYQGFLSRAFDIPITHVIGVKSVVRGGLLTDEMVVPIPQDAGKKEALETFIGAEPLVVAGNSRGDKDMIEWSRGLRIIVNPDEFVAPDQTESVADHAQRNGWLVVRIRDVPSPSFPAISSKQFGVGANVARDVP
jgi:phosphoserine phosphatase